MKKTHEAPEDGGVAGLALDESYNELATLRAENAALKARLLLVNEPPVYVAQPYPKQTSAGIVQDEAEHRLKVPHDFSK